MVSKLIQEADLRIVRENLTLRFEIAAEFLVTGSL